jgi:uncharacterized membrane protein YphA (DoxX/SURF4 family)
MKTTTAILLILLRLAIGWHFLYEGLHKWHTLEVGESLTNRPFTSAGYFREAPGPGAGFIRSQLGDADERLLAELTPLPVPAGQDPVTYPVRERMPPLLKQEWQDYVARFSEHFKFDDEQRKRAQAILEQGESQVVTWLTNPKVDENTPTVTKTYPTGVVEEKLSVPERVAEYKAELNNTRDLLARRLPAFNRDVEGKRLPAAKADLTRTRAGLAKDLKAKTEEYLEKPLWALLNENKSLTLAAASTAGLLGSSAGEGPLLAGSSLFHERLAMPEARGTLPGPPGHSKQWWIDRVTVWFLIVVGGCLMLGLFTRLNCLLAAGFLLTTYLLVPPFPWLPTPPAQEGNYLYVNKNLIELLALLALATTASGLWFGADALLRWLWLSMRGRPAAPQPAVRRAA